MKGIGTIGFTGYGNQKIKISGREIWEDGMDFDSGLIYINMYGFEGGTTKYRTTTIGSGKANPLLVVRGEDNAQSGTVTINAQPNFGNIPIAASGLTTGDIWRDGTTLKIVV